MKIRYFTSSFSESEEQELVGERSEFIAIALIKFVLELYPMKTKGVQEALHGVHRKQDEQREGSPAVVPNPELKGLDLKCLP